MRLISAVAPTAISPPPSTMVTFTMVLLTCVFWTLGTTNGPGALTFDAPTVGGDAMILRFSGSVVGGDTGVAGGVGLTDRATGAI